LLAGTRPRADVRRGARRDRRRRGQPAGLAVHGHADAPVRDRGADRRRRPAAHAGGRRRHPRRGDEREGRARAHARRQGDRGDRHAPARADERRARPAGRHRSDHRCGNDGAARLGDRRSSGSCDPQDADRDPDSVRAGRGRRADRRRPRGVRRGRSRNVGGGRSRFRALMETGSAQNGDIPIGFWTVGEGPIDLVWVGGAMSNLEVMWESAEYRRFCERLASFSRLILFDKRGMGLSDRVRIGTLEERMDDVAAVVDAAGAESAAGEGASEGGPMSLLFAATHPKRTRALVLCGAEVKEERTEDWPWGEATREEFEGYCTIEAIVPRWGKGLAIAHIAPSRKDDERAREWF